MKRTLKERIELLGLNYTKEILLIVGIIVLFLIGGVVIYFLLKEIYVAIAIGALGFVLAFFYLSRYSSLEKIQEKEHVDELISLLSYFEIFISNKNNVYISLKMLLPYCSTFMDDAIRTMLDQIDTDKTVGPFIKFASKFNNHIVESLMLSIYQMVDNGENIGQFSEFDILFSNIRGKYQEELIDTKKKVLDTLNSFPLIGAGFITITLSIAVISIIGDYVNVI